MSITKRDPLLAAGKLVVALFLALIIFSTVMVAIGLGAVLTVEKAATADMLAKAGAGPSAYAKLVAGMGVMIGVLLFAGWFMQVLYRLIRSVEEGDPFNPDNAARLARMGWLTLAIQGSLFIISLLALGIGTQRAALVAEDASDLSGGAIILTLVLFILARVFRLGTQMREDLEGTV